MNYLEAGSFVQSADHVPWTSLMDLELGHRAGLHMYEYWHICKERVRLGYLRTHARRLARVDNLELLARHFCFPYWKPTHLDSMETE
jgi:hypothetical protein